MKLFSILFLVCWLLFLPSTNSDAENNPVTFGIFASLTGNWAEIGQNIQEGATLASEEINKNGGIFERTLVLDFQDTDEEKSGGKVISSFRYLRGKGIEFFVGPTGVPGILALLPILKKENVVLVGSTATGAYYKQAENFFNAGGDNFYTTKASAEALF